jgi:S-adenosylmethionine:tRNA ribosyltransferase-isomerase
MIAASEPVQRPAAARLLVADRYGGLHHWPRAEFGRLLQAGDLLVANDAATLPASLSGRHVPSGRRIEVRLAGGDALAVDQVKRFAAVVFGLGDFRMRTEDRPPPPAMQPGDRLTLGPLTATIRRVTGNSRIVALEFDGTPHDLWEGLARHGRPIQYSHLQAPLAIWNTWTAIAGLPVAFEPPSAGFALDWHTLKGMTARGVGFATITHAAGISSTGDPALDALLPFDERYRVPVSTARAIARTRAQGGRIVAMGTTVVRALEHAAAAGHGPVHSGDGVATQRIGPATRLRIVDAMLSGTHERGASHYELLRAFVNDTRLRRIDDELEQRGYRTHEFGDSVFLDRASPADAKARNGSNGFTTAPPPTNLPG